ncbi:MAG: Holliday junction branch migration protein RuvA [Spirochaetota bacterium]
MFNSIRGILSAKRLDSICLETGGVEWDIAVPGRALDSFGMIGSESRAYTWLHHYEDGMRLFGFPSVEERAVFIELMKVEGIGPKQALRVLSGIGPEALEIALESEDLAALQKIPGVGPKLAQKMLLALKGKLVRTPEKPHPSRATPMVHPDIVRALSDMGFDRREAERVVTDKAAGKGEGPEAEKEIFRLALLELSAGA